MYDFSIGYRENIALLYPQNQKAFDWVDNNMRSRISERREKRFNGGILLSKDAAIKVIERIRKDYLTIGKVV